MGIDAPREISFAHVANNEEPLQIHHGLNDLKLTGRN